MTTCRHPGSGTMFAASSLPVLSIRTLCEVSNGYSSLHRLLWDCTHSYCHKCGDLSTIFSRHAQHHRIHGALRAEPGCALPCRQQDEFSIFHPDGVQGRQKLRAAFDLHEPLPFRPADTAQQLHGPQYRSKNHNRSHLSGVVCAGSGRVCEKVLGCLLWGWDVVSLVNQT